MDSNGRLNSTPEPGTARNRRFLRRADADLSARAEPSAPSSGGAMRPQALNVITQEPDMSAIPYAGSETTLDDRAMGFVLACIVLAIISCSTTLIFRGSWEPEPSAFHANVAAMDDES
jgi:hypothetical protein